MNACARKATADPPPDARPTSTRPSAVEASATTQAPPVASVAPPAIDATRAIGPMPSLGPYCLEDLLKCRNNGGTACECAPGPAPASKLEPPYLEVQLVAISD